MRHLAFDHPKWTFAGFSENRTWIARQAGDLSIFAIPLAEQGTQLATRLPDMIADARGGGQVGGRAAADARAPDASRLQDRTAA